MNRRELFKAVPALAAAAQVRAQSDAKGRLHAGLVAYSFRQQLAAKTLTYEALIRYVADLGLDGLDTTVYWFPDTSDAYLASLRRTAYKNGVSLYSIASRVRLCQPTPELQRAEVETAKKWIDVAVRLGAGHMRVFGGNVPKGATEAQAIPWAVEVLKRASEYAGKQGVILGIEDDGGLSATAEPTVEMVRRTDSEWAGINVDTGNFPRNGYAQVALCLPYAVSTHFKTHIASPEGKKENADWDRLMEMFVKAGYRGYLSLEYEDVATAETAIPKFAAELRSAVRRHSGSA